MKKFKVIREGVSFSKLSLYAEAIESHIDDFVCGENFFVPGNFLTAMFRSRIIIEILQEQNFPLKNIKSFRGSQGATYENRLYVDEPITYHFEQLAKLEKSGEYLYRVEIYRNKHHELILSDIFTFYGEDN